MTGQDGEMTAAKLLREIAAADPEAHRAAIGRGYGVGPVEPLAAGGPVEDWPVGQLAEIDWRRGVGDPTVETAVARWTRGSWVTVGPGRWLYQIWPALVTAVRPLKLIPADAIVLPEADPAGFDAPDVVYPQGWHGPADEDDLPPRNADRWRDVDEGLVTWAELATMVAEAGTYFRLVDALQERVESVAAPSVGTGTPAEEVSGGGDEPEATADRFPEAVEAAARAGFELTYPDEQWSRHVGPQTQEHYRIRAATCLTAALPHLPGAAEVAEMERQRNRARAKAGRVEDERDNAMAQLQHAEEQLVQVIAANGRWCTEVYRYQAAIGKVLAHCDENAAHSVTPEARGFARGYAARIRAELEAAGISAAASGGVA